MRKKKRKPEKFISVAEYAKQNNLSRPGVYYKMEHNLLRHELICGHYYIYRVQ